MMLRGWWSRRASGARVTSCSHSRFEGETIANFTPTLLFTAAPTRFRHPDFLGRCSWECTAFQGSLVFCRQPWASQQCSTAASLSFFLAFSLFAIAAKEARLYFQQVPDGVGLGARRPVGGRARSSCSLYRNVSEPLFHWRKVQMDSGLAPLGVQNLLSLLFQVFQSRRLAVAHQRATVWVFFCRRSDKAILSHLAPVARESCVDLASSTARWTRLVAAKHQGPLHCSIGERRSVWLARLHWLLALQTVTTVRRQWKRH